MMIGKRMGLAAIAAAVFSMVTSACRANYDQQPARHVDIYGDPLPEGAIARLGTVRYRAAIGTGRIEFLADSRTLIGCGRARVVWLDVPTGRVVREVEMDVYSTVLLAISNDRSLIAVATREMLPDVRASIWRVVIMDASSGEVRSRLNYRGTSVGQRIVAACFTPDGTQLVTCDGDAVVRTWKVGSGQEQIRVVRSLPSSARVVGIACSGNGKWLVACNEIMAYRWEWKTGGEFHEFGRPPVPQAGDPSQIFLTLELSPDGRTVALGSGHEEPVRLFDVETGESIRSLSAPARYYYPHQLAFTSGGSRVITPSSNNLVAVRPEPPGEVDVWDVASGELLDALPYQVGLRRVAVSPDDRWVAATGGSVIAWDLETGERVGARFFGHLSQFRTLAVSPDGTQVATAGREGWAALWDAQTGEPMHVLHHHPGKAVGAVAFSPDGNMVATSAADNTVVIWDRDTGERIYTVLGHGLLGGSCFLKFTPDSEQLLSFGRDLFLRVFDVGTGKALHEHPIRPSGFPLKDAIDGGVEWESNEMLLLESLRDGRFTPNGKSLVLVIGAVAHLFNVSSGAEQTRYELRDGTDSLTVSLSADGVRLATLRRAGDPQPRGDWSVDESGRAYSIDIHNLETGELEHAIRLRHPTHPYIALSPDGTKVATTRGELRVYDIATGRELARIEPKTALISGVAFTPDGERLIATHGDKSAVIWDWRQFLIDEETDQ